MTEVFTFTDEFLIGNETVDTEHRHLFELANRAMEIWDPYRRLDDFREIIGELHQYVRDHFEHEEELMAEISYDRLEEHRESHRVITRRFAELTATDDSLGQLGSELRPLLNDWIVDHVLAEDMKIKHWVALQKPVGLLKRLFGI